MVDLNPPAWLSLLMILILACAENPGATSAPLSEYDCNVYINDKLLYESTLNTIDSAEVLCSKYLFRDNVLGACR